MQPNTSLRVVNSVDDVERERESSGSAQVRRFFLVSLLVKAKEREREGEREAVCFFGVNMAGRIEGDCVSC
ncbi:unnamed protein product, partial [Brassica oleracea var. botrytis]